MSANLNGNNNTAMQESRAPQNYRPEYIAGKNIIVSGGTTGIGRAIARLLTERGARVFVFGRDASALQETLAELKPLGEAYGTTADQSQLEDVKRLFDEAERELGKVDILINNAAVTAGSVMENSVEELAYGVNANIVGYIACTKEAVERMKTKAPTQSEDEVDIKGHIINVGSLSADLREEGNDVYVATKAAIQAFSQSLRKSCNPEGIKVSLIEPGLVLSDMSTQSTSLEEAEQKIREGSMLRPQEIAEAVHYIVTQPARCDVINVQIRPHCQTI